MSNISKVKTLLDKKQDDDDDDDEHTAVDLLIVAHGAETNDTAFYGSSGCCTGPSRKSLNEIVLLLKSGLSTSLILQKIKGIYLWVCCAGMSGLGTAFKGAIRDSGVPVYATNEDIGGVAVWNRGGGAAITKANTFYLIE